MMGPFGWVLDKSLGISSKEKVIYYLYSISYSTLLCLSLQAWPAAHFCVTNSHEGKTETEVIKSHTYRVIITGHDNEWDY
ncbi:hypothetical protein BO85DRAFT_301188 [Aspergillus piperis CBS 112811]|uniref:Uncharacterized protein n=1 Tax=Aspergillus piperis CBS 112811 TaxID=1448313 RepID=A0A8G1QZU6_9EURO|nr:hypothetical protein BO85DRAFT_301188 [Aspergillus piperis CBS 112811]RAH57461.1 hypothetical protein BO85DRAFT_301188 [Aspergillus piperis CBS 112811]